MRGTKRSRRRRRLLKRWSPCGCWYCAPAWRAYQWRERKRALHAREARDEVGR